MINPTNVTESSSYALINFIKNNLGPILSSISTERDNKVNLEQPKEYFTWATAKAFRCPAIFAICENVDLRPTIGQNHINAAMSYIVSIVVEDKSEELLQKKCWRYQDALTTLFMNATIITENQDIMLKTIVKNIYFSEQFSEKRDDLIFRKEVALDLGVEHYENNG